MPKITVLSAIKIKRQPSLYLGNVHDSHTVSFLSTARVHLLPQNDQIMVLMVSRMVHLKQNLEYKKYPAQMLMSS